MSPVFRGKFLALLGEAYAAGAFAHVDTFRDPSAYGRLVAKVTTLSWNVYAKAPLDSAQHVVAYLGRYTHRVGIANSRLLDVSDDTVTFRTKGKDTKTLSHVDFLGRLVQHVLPDGFHKIRHVGLYAPASKDRCDKARSRLGAAPAWPTLTSSWRQRLAQLTGRNVAVCPRCGGPLVSVPLPRSRDPPGVAA
jgi:hypothetical protein